MAVGPQGGVVNEDVDQDTAISEALPSAPQTDDYDDVEGHGLREVAIGVTAADSGTRISSFGDQIVQGETDVVHHDVKAASKLLRNITH